MHKKLIFSYFSYFFFQTRELHKIGHRDEELSFKRFVYRPMDLNTMEQYVQHQKYRCVEELVADAHNIVHNVFLMYGGKLLFYLYFFLFVSFM